MKSSCRSQPTPQILDYYYIKNKLTNLCGNRLFKNGIQNTVCEIKTLSFAISMSFSRCETCVVTDLLHINFLHFKASQKATIERELMAPRTHRTSRILSSVASLITTKHAAKGSVFVSPRKAGNVRDMHRCRPAPFDRPCLMLWGARFAHGPTLFVGVEG